MSAPPAEQANHNAIRHQCSNAERNRLTPMREESSESKDDGGECNEPSHNGPLTVKLRGRTTTPDRGRGPAISTGSRGPKQTTPHGPLQRLLAVVATQLYDDARTGFRGIGPLVLIKPRA